MENTFRGGLNYKIQIIGNWEKKLDSFEKRINGLEKAAAKVSLTGDSKGVSKTAKTQEDINKSLTSEQRSRNAIEKAVSRTNDAITVSNSKEVQGLRDKLSLNESLNKKRRDLNRVLKENSALSDRELKATLANAKVQEKTLSISDRIADARKNGKTSLEDIAKYTGIANKKLAENDPILNSQLQRNLEIAKAQKEQAKQIARARKETEQLADRANSVFYTFRRLVGILAVFTLARKLSAYLGEAVIEMSRFNAVMEDSRISIGALLSATTQIVDENGKIVAGAEALKLNYTEAERQILQLRVEALKTTATFEDLLNAFQIAVGPGFKAGLGADQILQTSVNIAKAATALQVPANQLGEEIRSLLQGTINIRNTRLSVLQISNDQIKTARKEGVLFELLAKSLEAFALSSDDVAKTYSGLQSNLKESMSILLAVGAVEYFEELKSTMSGVINTLQDMEGKKGNNFGMNEDAVRGIQAVSTAMAQVIRDFKEFITADEALSAMRVNLEAIGLYIRLAGRVIAPFVAGIAEGLTIISEMVVMVGKLVKGLASLAGVSDVLSFFSKMLSYIIAINVATGVWFNVLKIVRGEHLKILRLLGLNKTYMITIKLLMTAYNTLAAAAALNWTRAAQQVGVFMKLLKRGNIVITVLLAVLTFIAHKTGLLAKAWKMLDEAISGGTDTAGEMKDAVDDISARIANQTDAVGKLEDAYADLDETIKDLRLDIIKTLAVKNLTGNTKEIFGAIADFEAKRNKTLRDTQEQIKRNREELEKVESQKEGISGFEEILKNKGEIEETIKTYRDLYRELRIEQAKQVSSPTDKFIEGTLGLKKNEASPGIEAGLRRELLLETQKLKPLMDVSQGGESPEDILNRIIALEEERLRIIASIETAEEAITQKADEYEELFNLTIQNQLAGIEPLETQADLLGATADYYKEVADNAWSTTAAHDAMGSSLLFQTMQMEKQMEILAKQKEDQQKKRDEIGTGFLKDASTGETIKLSAANQEGMAAEVSAEMALIDKKMALLDAKITQNRLNASLEKAQGQGGVVGGMSGGAAAFVQQNQGQGGGLGGAVAGGTNQLLAGIGPAIGGEVANAIKTGEFDLAQAGIDLLADAIGNIVSNIITQLITQLLAQMFVQSGLLALISSGVWTLVAETITTVISAIGTMIGILLGILIKPFHTGGFVGRNSGGAMNGYPTGGLVKGPGLSKAPKGFHPKDKIPAMLTNREYVINAGTVASFGKPFFDALNFGNTLDLSSIAAAGAFKGGIMGLAAGGSASPSSVITANTSNNNKREILAVGVMPVTPSYARQIISAGKNEIISMIENNPLMFKKALQV